MMATQKKIILQGFGRILLTREAFKTVNSIFSHRMENP